MMSLSQLSTERFIGYVRKSKLFENSEEKKFYQLMGKISSVNTIYKEK